MSLPSRHPEPVSAGAKRIALSPITSQREWLNKAVSQDSGLEDDVGCRTRANPKQVSVVAKLIQKSETRQHRVHSAPTEAARIREELKLHDEDAMQQLCLEQAQELRAMRRAAEEAAEETARLREEIEQLKSAPSSPTSPMSPTVEEAAEAAEFAQFKGMLRNLQQAMHAKQTEGGEMDMAIRKSAAFKQAGAMLRGWIERLAEQEPPAASAPPLKLQATVTPPVARVLSVRPPAPVEPAMRFATRV